MTDSTLTLRRRDLLAADDKLVAFYLERIPADVASVKSFEHWWRTEAQRQPHRLDVPREVMLAQPFPPLVPGDHPDTWEVDGNTLRLTYRFDPTRRDTGKPYMVVCRQRRQRYQRHLSSAFPCIYNKDVHDMGSEYGIQL